jgi:hypothetical protein
MEMEEIEKDKMSSERLYELQRKCDVYSFGALLFELLSGQEFKKLNIAAVKLED